jgi:hypothetical protein
LLLLDEYIREGVPRCTGFLSLTSTTGFSNTTYQHEQIKLQLF